MKEYFVYVLTNKRNGTLYIGMTNDIERRVQEHKHKQVDGFTKRYGLDKLVYFETFEDSRSALLREKQMKKWKRSWKLEIIEEMNPDWNDLAKDW